MFTDAAQSDSPKLVKIQATYVYSDGFKVSFEKVGDDLTKPGDKFKPGDISKPGNNGKP
jgi:hypothetical protein